MSFLNDQKRARRGAKTLLRLILEKNNFEKNLDDYTASDGIIDADFLPKLDEARKLVGEIENPDFIVRLEAQPINFIEAIIEHLIQAERFDLLLAVRDNCKDKNIKKSVKQHIHILNTKGVKIEKRQPKTWTLDAKNEKAEAVNLISEYDPRGERFLVYSIGMIDGLKVLQVIENDMGGVKEYNYFKLSRSKAKTYVSDILIEFSYMNTDPDVAYWFIERALKRNESSGQKIPSGFITALSNMEKPKKSLQKHPFFDNVRPVDLEHPEGSIAKSADIFKHQLAAYWTIDPVAWRDFQYELYQVAPSEQSMADPAVRKKVRKLADDIIEKYCTPANRRALAERLLDMAWICMANKERDTALAAYGTSVVLQSDRPTREIPFCKELLGRFFPVDEAGTDSSESKIILPG